MHNDEILTTRMNTLIPSSTKALYILHHTDLDGKCSAAIIRLWNDANYNLPITFIPVDYGKEKEALGILDAVPSPSITVLLVDFTLPAKEMESLYQDLGNNFVWIDHHKTNVERFKNIKGVRDSESGRAACAIVWDLCFYTPPPYWVKLLSDYDIWNHKDPETLPFQYGMRTTDNAPNSNTWLDLHILSLADPHGVSSLMGHILRKGTAIIAYNKQLWADMMAAGAFELTFHGLRCIACNTGAGASSSQMFESVYDPEKHDAMMTFKYTGINWSISMYTTKTDQYDMGDVCKKHRGGGGHPGAAGFVVGSDELTDDITKYFKDFAWDRL